MSRTSALLAVATLATGCAINYTVEETTQDYDFESPIRALEVDVEFHFGHFTDKIVWDHRLSLRDAQTHLPRLAGKRLADSFLHWWGSQPLIVKDRAFHNGSLLLAAIVTQDRALRQGGKVKVATRLPIPDT